MEAYRCPTKNPKGSGQRPSKDERRLFASTKKKRKYREADDRIKRLVTRFIGIQLQSMIDFLRGVSHNFEMDP